MKQIFDRLTKRNLKSQRGKSLSSHCLYTGLKKFITNCSSVYWYFTVFILAIVKSAKYKPRSYLRALAMNGLASFLFYNLKKKSELKVYTAKSIEMVKVTLLHLLFIPTIKFKHTSKGLSLWLRIQLLPLYHREWLVCISKYINKRTFGNIS